ncbi:undecaprenyl-phosphate galactosephosphotransferase [alpha proteobacterium U9-1i]|nr:undecaprenyl-phosphate galactosephosphotransferase [alpha proteobacterium U9-1i]
MTDRRLIRKARLANGRAKRFFDVVLASLLLAFLMPALLTIAAAIKLTDPGPIFYRHKRLGRRGKRFGCIKFRTMAVDSEARLRHLLETDPNAAAEWLESQKLRNDPRVTRIGAFLRKTSLDELPQLWNVIKGEMSMIGPRPITRDELARYGRDRRFYLLVRPGISGLWQVSGRSSVSYDRRVQYDREYLEEWSWFQELRIAALTLPAVMFARDAC